MTSEIIFYEIHYEISAFILEFIYIVNSAILVNTFIINEIYLWVCVEAGFFKELTKQKDCHECGLHYPIG